MGKLGLRLDTTPPLSWHSLTDMDPSYGDLSNLIAKGTSGLVNDLSVSFSNEVTIEYEENIWYTNSKT